MCLSKSKVPARPESIHSPSVKHLKTRPDIVPSHPKAHPTPELRNSCVEKKAGSPKMALLTLMGVCRFNWVISAVKYV